MTSREQYEKERNRAAAINLGGGLVAGSGLGYAAYQGLGHSITEAFNEKTVR